MIPNIQIAPGTQVLFQRFCRIVHAYTTDGHSIPVDVEYEILHGTVVSDDGETADVFVDDAFRKETYHLKHSELTYVSPPSTVSFDQLLQGR